MADPSLGTGDGCLFDQGAVCEQDTASRRAQDKRRAKLQKALANEFTSMLAAPILELEQIMEKGNSTEKDLARFQRLALKEALKVVANASLAPEDRLKHLQTKYAALAQDYNTALLLNASLTVQVKEQSKEKDKALEQSARHRDLADKLQRLCTDINAESDRLRREQANQIKTMQEVDSELRKRDEATKVVVAHYSQLQEENLKLKEQFLAATNLSMKMEEAMKKAEEIGNDKLAKLQRQVEAQGDIRASVEQVRSQIDQHQEHLAAQAKALEMQKLENKRLEMEKQLLQSQKTHLDLQNKQLREAHQVLEKKTKSVLTSMSSTKEVISQLQEECSSQRAVLPGLLKERTEKLVLEKQVVQMQEEMKRVKGQKERLEGLCRALQARLGAAEPAGFGEPAPASAADAGSGAAAAASRQVQLAAPAACSVGGQAAGAPTAEFESSTGSADISQCVHAVVSRCIANIIAGEQQG